MNDTIVRAENISKVYGTKTVLSDVSFTIEKGRIYGFIGENGAGKTTSIRNSKPSPASLRSATSPKGRGKTFESIALFGK